MTNGNTFMISMRTSESTIHGTFEKQGHCRFYTPHGFVVFNKPSRIIARRTNICSGRFIPSTITVTRPVGVVPRISAVFAITKCDAHVCNLGLNSDTNCFVSGSIPPRFGPLCRLQNGQAKRFMSFPPFSATARARRVAGQFPRWAAPGQNSPPPGAAVFQAAGDRVAVPSAEFNRRAHICNPNLRVSISEPLHDAFDQIHSFHRVCMAQVQRGQQPDDLVA